jgi:AbrB family looped-hinge helix DNA binding protein
MSYLSKLTTKSQITVPKDVRTALGVGPGQQVKFDIGEDGRVSLVAADSAEEQERRKQDFLSRVAEVRKRFRLQDQFAGMDGLEYQRWIRPDRIDQ